MSQSLTISYEIKQVRVSSKVVAGNFVAGLQSLDKDGAPVGSPAFFTNVVPVITIPNILDGDYSIKHFRADTSGNPIGGTFMDVVTIANGAVVIDQLVDVISSVSYQLDQTPEETAAAGPA